MDIKEAFSFCPRCGAKFDKLAAYHKCPSCGLAYYFNPKPVQSVILFNDKDEILFVIRGVEPRKGFLDFPGGFVDQNENFEETSRREVKEELGIDIGELEYLSSHTDDYLFDNILYKVSGVTYTGRLPAGAELKPADDVSGYEFYKLKDVPLDRISFPSIREMLEKLAQTTT
jgi:ADP-ribose pyrophosphatase YjhB (NUDIX family)